MVRRLRETIASALFSLAASRKSNFSAVRIRKFYWNRNFVYGILVARTSPLNAATALPNGISAKEDTQIPVLRQFSTGRLRQKLRPKVAKSNCRARPPDRSTRSSRTCKAGKAVSIVPEHRQLTTNERRTSLARTGACTLRICSPTKTPDKERNESTNAWLAWNSTRALTRLSYQRSSREILNGTRRTHRHEDGAFSIQAPLRDTLATLQIAWPLGGPRCLPMFNLNSGDSGLFAATGVPCLLVKQRPGSL